MRTRLCCCAAALLFVAQPCFGQIAPDRTLSAKVHRQDSARADRIEVRSIPDGARIWSASTAPLSVENIVWTPDSQFLVWSGANAGGHQPWHHPVHAWSRKTRQILVLEAYLPGPVDEPSLKVAPPAKLTVSVQDHIATELDLSKLNGRRP